MRDSHGGGICASVALFCKRSLLPGHEPFSGGFKDTGSWAKRNFVALLLPLLAGAGALPG